MCVHVRMCVCVCVRACVHLWIQFCLFVCFLSQYLCFLLSPNISLCLCFEIWHGLCGVPSVINEHYHGKTLLACWYWYDSQDDETGTTKKVRASWRPNGVMRASIAVFPVPLPHWIIVVLVLVFPAVFVFLAQWSCPVVVSVSYVARAVEISIFIV